MKKRIIIILLCIIGLTAVTYGIVTENDIIFIIGIAFVIAGYAMIRKILKRSIREKGGLE